MSSLTCYVVPLRSLQQAVAVAAVIVVVVVAATVQLRRAVAAVAHPRLRVRDAQALEVAAPKRRPVLGDLPAIADAAVPAKLRVDHKQQQACATRLENGNNNKSKQHGNC